MKRATLFAFYLFMGSMAQAAAGTSTWNLQNRDFDLVISYYGFPAGDNDGNHQNPSNPSTQDRIETIIQYFADGVYEMTEGAHRLKDIRIYLHERRKNLLECGDLSPL